MAILADYPGTNVAHTLQYFCETKAQFLVKVLYGHNQGVKSMYGTVWT